MDKRDNKSKDVSRPRMGENNENNEELASNLHYNQEKDSYNLDVDSETEDYVHPSGYSSSAEGGEDMNSDWDEANLYIGDEYDNQSDAIANEMDEANLYIRGKKSIKTSRLDKKISQTNEDKRDDLDEEGYPRNNGKPMP